MHFFVHRVERVHVEQPAADAGLVGRHHDLEARLVQAGNRFETAGNGFPFGGRFNEVIGVVINDAVTVEDDEFHTPSFEMSATALS